MKSTRLIYCTYSSLYSSIVLETLLKAPNIQVVGIINSTRILKKQYGYLRGVLEMIRASGLRYVLYQAWATDLFYLAQPFSLRKTIQYLAKQNEIPIHETKDIHNESGLQFVRSLKPDVILTAYFNQLLKEPLISLPPLGCLNIHPSLLPHYRGTDPIFYALHHEEKEIGVSVYSLDDQFDTGDILMQQAVTVVDNLAVLSYYCMLFELGAQMTLTCIEQLNEGKTGSPQVRDGNYDTWPTGSAVAAFLRQGKKLVSAREYLKILRRFSEILTA